MADSPIEPELVYLSDIAALSSEDRSRLAEKHALPAPVLDHYLELLVLRQIPSERLDETLRDMATRYAALSEGLRQLPEADPVVAVLFEQARTALAAAFSRVESLLNEASDQALRATEADAVSDERALVAAASKAANGALKNSELAYAEAAEYYRQAAALVPSSHELTLASYLQDEGLALLRAGRPNQADGPLTRALAIREKALDPMHVDLAGLATTWAGYTTTKAATARPSRSTVAP